MFIMMDTISNAMVHFEEVDVDIVNWHFQVFQIQDYARLDDPGLLTPEPDLPRNCPKEFSPLDALKSKALTRVNRTRQTEREFILGKIIFGIYSRSLISRIFDATGSLFGGVTHDYSAMVQALATARKCVDLNFVGIIFVSLPVHQSTGSRTYYSTTDSLEYFNQLSNSESAISSQLVPGLWASQHNMVSHDYIKYLSIYGLESLFNRTAWLEAIHQDVTLRDRIWLDSWEKESQVSVFYAYLQENKLLLKVLGRVAAGKAYDLLSKSKRFFSSLFRIANASFNIFPNRRRGGSSRKEPITLQDAIEGLRD